MQNTTNSTTFLLYYSFASNLVTQYGAPVSMWLNFTITLAGNISIDWQLFNKTTTRQPEALWLQFTPLNSSEAIWQFDKLGEWVGTNETMLNGSHHLHGVNTGVRFTSGNGTRLLIEFIDAALASAGAAFS